MTFEQYEQSPEGGHKVYLYTWRRGATTWRYANYDRNIGAGVNTYAAAPIQHDAIEQSTDVQRMEMRVETPIDHPVAVQFRAQAPTETITLTIAAMHVNDPDQEVRAAWTGRVISVDVDLPRNKAIIQHSPTYTSLSRLGLRRRAQTKCPHVLYGTACKASQALFQVIATVTNMSGVTITANDFGGKPAKYWDGGYIEYQSNGLTERRGIMSATGVTLTLSAPPVGLAIGQSVTALPGCDHTTGANGCQKFSNILNYGGFPEFPRKNPFGSDPIY